MGEAKGKKRRPRRPSMGQVVSPGSEDPRDLGGYFESERERWDTHFVGACRGKAPYHDYSLEGLRVVAEKVRAARQWLRDLESDLAHQIEEAEQPSAVVTSLEGRGGSQPGRPDKESP